MTIPFRHAYIVEYKTAYYSFYLPIALAMRMANITSEAAYEQAKAVLIPLGEYFQVQDDYLDCYGAPEVIGKIGTDIEDNKCGWLIVQALDRANPQQREILDVRRAKPLFCNQVTDPGDRKITAVNPQSQCKRSKLCTLI